MNWYLIVLLAVFAISHTSTVYKSTKGKSALEATITAIVFSMFWWLFYMAGIFTLL